MICQICSKEVSNLYSHIKFCHKEYDKTKYINCKICNQKIPSKGLIYHITHTHFITDQNYYDQYLKKENEGKCTICNNTTNFINIREGYKTLCEQHANKIPMITCKICSFSCKLSSFCTHLKIHQLTGNEYYDKYLKKENEGLCQKCGKSTEYLGLSKGYKPLCDKCKKESLKLVECNICKKLVVNLLSHIKHCHKDFDNTNYIYCKKCGQKITTKGLSQHIDNVHNEYSKKEFYDLYYKKETEGVCEKCGNEAIFLNINKGYHKLCEQCIEKPIEYNCPICNKLIKNTAPHFYKTHHISPKDYYDLYLKKENEGNCIICGNDTSFISIIKGYCKHCNNPSCSQLDESIQNKIKKTCLKRYNVEYAFQSDIVKEKSKQTCLEKYGVEYSFQSENNKIKAKQTKKEIYGNENYNNREKCKQTTQQKYGVDNVLQAKEIQEKIKQTNVERYGAENLYATNYGKQKIKETLLQKYNADNPMKSKQIKEKIQQTNINKYGGISPFCNKKVREKIQQTINNNINIDNTLNEDDL